MFALYAGMQYNAMGEFCRDDSLDVCKIDYLYASATFLSWVVVSFLTQIIAIYLVRVLIRLIITWHHGQVRHADKGHDVLSPRHSGREIKN